MNTAQKQNLFPLIFDASQRLPGYERIEAQYFASVAAQVSQQAQKTADFLQLYNAFLADGLSPIVLKGIICRSLYGDRADFRPSGDEDILVSKDDYAEAIRVLNNCGYTTDEKPDKDLDLVQEVTFKSPESPLTIELHLNPFGTENNIRSSMNEWFRNVFDSQETLLIENVPIRTLEQTDHMLFLIFHAFKHFIRGGFGIRLMLDTLLFAEKYFDCINWDYISRGLASVNATGFYDDLVILGNKYLGFTLPEKETGTSPDELLDDMFHMGTFGNTNTADRVAAVITADVVQKVSDRNKVDCSKSSKLCSMFRGLFPSWQTWISKKPYLKDKPWMLPVEWVKRLVHFLRGQTDMSSMKEIGGGCEIADRRIELLKKYKVL